MSNEAQFVDRYGPTWQRFEDLLREAEAKNSEEPVDELPRLYRQLCQHLSIARHRGYRASVVERLNRLVERGHALLYGTRTGKWGPIMSYIGGGFARDVREDWHLFAVAALLFYGPFFAMIAWLQFEPEWAYHVLGPEMASSMEQMYSEPSVRPLEETDSDVLMFGYYIYNNISIALRTFASGFLAGIGSLFTLVYNGSVLGAAAGHVQNAGFGSHFWSFVVGHGSLELTAIVLSGQAGFKIGFAPIWPGRRTRLQALQEEARDSVGLVGGFFGMLVIAAFVEAFWSSSTASAPIKYLVGGLLWSAVILYFIFAGRGDESG
jgi:uncharacterized membrane protein SpoIIM required for sporulation